MSVPLRHDFILDPCRVIVLKISLEYTEDGYLTLFFLKPRFGVDNGTMGGPFSQGEHDDHPVD